MLWLVFAATAAAAAAIPTGPEISPADLVAPHRLRGGVVIGLTLGGGVVGASGYPNDVNRIGDRNYYSASGLMTGTAESLFVMGALTDYLSFGFWYAHAAASNGDFRSNGDGGGLRVEVFPFAALTGIALAPWLSGVGAVGQFGIGSGSLAVKRPGFPTAEGTQAFVGAGVFYEWSFAHVLGGHFGAGPNLEYDAIFSLPFERHGLIASARLVFYGGP
jgi:hypothetical protein